MAKNFYSKFFILDNWGDRHHKQIYFNLILVQIIRCTQYLPPKVDFLVIDSKANHECVEHAYCKIEIQKKVNQAHHMTFF